MNPLRFKLTNTKTKNIPNIYIYIYIVFALLQKYEAIITPGNEHVVHHMEVFHCDSTSSSSKNSVLEEFPIWDGPCGSDDAPEKLSQCKRVLAAWAIGAGPFVYPKVCRV